MPIQLAISSCACGGDAGSGIVDAAGIADSHPNGDTGSSADASPTIDGGGSSGPPFQPLRVGYINLIEGGGGQSVFASIRDKPEVPAPTLAASAGDCQIWVHPEPALCEPPCSDGFCIDTNSCEPWPQFAPAGVITVSGLREALSFVPNTYWYDANPYPSSADLFETEAEISATAPGDLSDGFTVDALGVAPLVAEFPVTLEIEDEVDEQITWTPAGSGRIQLALLVGWHGAPYEAMLLCETEDDGSLTIPGSLISQFPRASNSMEQHFSWLARFDRDVADTSAGPVELFVGSMVVITQLSHP